MGLQFGRRERRVVPHFTTTMEQHDSENSGEGAQKPRTRRRASRYLGIDLPEWEDEHRAPAVDEKQVDALLDGRLEREEFRRIAALIWRFRSWAEAYCRLATERDRPPAGE